jgi:anaerobic ribonucleoside-triphosphate reductase
MKKVKTEIYSRVSGYYRPVVQWNPGKRAEYVDRAKLALPKEFRNETVVKG